MVTTREESDEAGEGYFASISDLMVGILFIFLLMLAAFAINYANEDKDAKIKQLEERVRQLEKQVTDQKHEIDRLKSENEELHRDRDRLRAAIAKVLKQLEGVMHAQGDAKC